MLTRKDAPSERGHVAFQPSITLQPWRSRPSLTVSQTPRPIRRYAVPIHFRTPRQSPQRISNRPPRCAVKAWETLTATEFDTRMDEKSLAICFVGMSNCGKSHWSNKLHTACDFHLLSVDEKIERAIEPELQALGYSGIDGMAEWMGFPSDTRFAANQASYLTHEEIITAAARPATGTNSVLDTTGSVIYLSDNTVAMLRREYLVVHLEASDDMLDFMTTNYFETPKPVVWGDAFKPIEGETANESLRRCYPNLLRERRRRYQAISHIAIPASTSLSREISLDGFLDELKSKLR